ncbi:hypothetical protein PCANC_11842 [Puccinia coronata f. sp. avenae]|uniref:Uncharacterized protein n=1 Tax=Puccinia coronata f. sp. avenae TaxID=200324 RepID=A0A2N5T0E2_9BASI|nr:hypothetical protein PCANC_11842 [Puccinia coronata f. sp. avenae]
MRLEPRRICTITGPVGFPAVNQMIILLPTLNGLFILQIKHVNKIKESKSAISNPLIAMNFMLNLLIIVTELAVSCRAGMEWNPLEDHWKHWNEEGRRLLEHLNQSTSPTRYHPYPSSHSSITNELTPSPSTSGVPDHFIMEDHATRPPTNSPNIYSRLPEPTYSWPVSSHVDPVTSNTPGNSFAYTPEDMDDDFFAGLSDNLEEYFITHSDAANEELKMADRFPGQLTSSNNPIKHIAQKNLPLVDAIGMNTEEGDFYRLVFTRDLFHFPESDNAQIIDKMDMIDWIIKKRAAESPSNIAALVIKSDEMNIFMEPFRSALPKNYVTKKALKTLDLKRAFSQNSAGDQKAPKTSDLRRDFSQNSGGKKPLKTSDLKRAFFYDSGDDIIAPKTSDLKRTFSQNAGDKNAPKTSDLAVAAISFLSESTDSWMNVYLQWSKKCISTSSPTSFLLT